MNVMQNLMESLRPIVGPQGWDYCVLWKLSDDHSSVEFMDCVCSGTSVDAQNREELQDSVSLFHPCKDLIFGHSRTKACDLLGKLPSSIPLDSGIYAQVLLSSQPSWCTLPDIAESGVLDETSGSSVLIPLPGRLIELFSTKQVAGDQRVIDFVTSQFSIAMEQESVLCSSNMDVSFLPVSGKAVESNLDVGNENHQMDPTNNFQTHLSQSISLQNVNLPYDLSVDRIHLCSSSMNMSQQYNCNTEDKANHDIFYEGSNAIFNSNNNNATNPFNPSLDNALQDIDEIQKTMMNNSGNIHLQYTEPMTDQGTEKDVINHETGRSDSISECSDQIDDEDNQKCTTNGKRPQSKNLMAERKRRKKLNDRLYALRALVPNISKLDKASILGDAIKYVKELLKQAKDLQDELEENSDDDDGAGRNDPKMQSEILSKNGVLPKAEDDNPPNGCYVGASGNGSINYSKQFQESENVMDKCQEMEPQVEVAQIDGNEFYVKVFCEHRANGFVRLMEALNSLGLEITNVNVTRFRGLVSNVFKVEKKESEFVQADYVRDSLLEVTRNPSRGWMFKSTQGPDSDGGIEFLSQHNHHMSSIHHLHD